MRKLSMLVTALCLSATLLGAEAIIQIKAHVSNDVLTVVAEDIDFGKNLYVGETVDARSKLTVTGKKDLGIKVEIQKDAFIKHESGHEMKVELLNHSEVTAENAHKLTKEPSNGVGSPMVGETDMNLAFRLKVPREAQDGEYRGATVVKVRAN